MTEPSRGDKDDQARGLLALLTNLDPRNLGNQLLTHQMVSLFSERSPGIESFHRLPSVYVASLPDDLEPWLNVARQAADRDLRHDRIKTGASGSTPARLGAIARTLSGPPSSARRKLVRYIRHSGLRRQFASLESRSGARQLGAIGQARGVVYNGAGEFLAGGRPIGRMFELAYAKECSIPFAIVNVTYEPIDAMKPYVLETWPSASSIFVRERSSADRLVAHGVSARRLEVVPDAGLLYSPPASSPLSGALAVAFNPTIDGGDERAWGRLVRALDKRGYSVTFVSNEYSRDLPMARRVRASGAPLRIAAPARDFRAYAELLSSFEVIVSNRFHTALMGAVCHRRVIGIESNSARLSEGLAPWLPELDVVDSGHPRWDQAALSAVGSAVSIDPAHLRPARSAIRAAYDTVLVG